MTDILHHQNYTSSSASVACYWKSLWLELNSMRHTMDFCDVSFITSDDKTFTAHSLILVASSSLFRRYFLKNGFTSFNIINSKLNLELNDIHSDVLEVVLNFIYGLKPISNEQILNLFVGSKLLEVEEAYKYCLHKINFDRDLVKLLNAKFDSSLIDLVLQDVGCLEYLFNDPEHTNTSFYEQTFVKENRDAPTSLSVDSHEKSENETEDSELKSANLFAQVDDSQLKNDNEHSKLIELSLSDLTQNNECPHLKSLNINNDFIPFIDDTKDSFNNVWTVTEQDSNINNSSSHLKSIITLNQIVENNCDDIINDGGPYENHENHCTLTSNTLTFNTQNCMSLDLNDANNQFDDTKIDFQHKNNKEYNLFSNENQVLFCEKNNLERENPESSSLPTQPALTYELTALENQLFSHVDELFDNIDTSDIVTLFDQNKFFDNFNNSICDGSVNDEFKTAQEAYVNNDPNVLSYECSTTDITSSTYPFSCESIDNEQDDNFNSMPLPIGNDINLYCKHISAVEDILPSDIPSNQNSLKFRQNFPKSSAPTTKNVVNSDTESKQQQIKPLKHPANFVCHDCGEVLNTSYKLQAHQLKEHHKGKLFICKHCTFKSPRKKDLQAHCLSQHDEQPHGVKIYVCSRCQYKCIDKNRFEEHEAMHLGIPKFKCPLCERAYTTRRGMKTHLKYHNVSRPYKCTMCTAGFKVKSKLTDHMKLVHLQKGFKPYKCAYCNHCTALRGNCNQHVKKNHPGLPVIVIDTASDQRKVRTNYDYANLEGSDIDELHEMNSRIRKS